MAVKNLGRGQVTRPSPRSMKMHRYPAPLKGVDFRQALVTSDPMICTYTYNLIPYESGMTVRVGYREWQIGLDLGDSVGVHTMIPFDGLDQEGGEDRLFAVTNEGIWDVTIATASPVLKFEFSDKQIDAGYGVYTHHIDDGENDLLLYADSRNGLFVYEASTDTWDQASGINGPVITNVRFIVSHKQRLWMVEENSSKAWYLPVGSHSGNATEFFFGSKFKHGGNVAGIFNWTIDGGDGVDDYLVAVSRAGDVLPYRGADPAISDGADAWTIVGTYFIGAVPVGPFFGSEHGGELMLLSTNGLTSMNDLLQGVNRDVKNARGYTDTIAGPVTASLRLRLNQSLHLYGWEVKVLPSQGGLAVNTPRINTGPYLQYFYTFATQAWALLRDIPALSFDTWQGSAVFGDDQSRVLYMDTGADNVLITPPAEGQNGDPVKFSVLSSFQDLESPSQYKKVKLIRPDFVAIAEPAYTVSAVYDYDNDEIINLSVPPSVAGTVWDVATWDQAFWGGGEVNSYNSVGGAWGYGRYIAIAMVGHSREKTNFVGWDVMFTVGGPML